MVVRIYIYMPSPTSLWWLYLEDREFWILNVFSEKNCIFIRTKKSYNNSSNVTGETLVQSAKSRINCGAHQQVVYSFGILAWKGTFCPVESGCLSTTVSYLWHLWNKYFKYRTLRSSQILTMDYNLTIIYNLNFKPLVYLVTSESCWSWDQHQVRNRKQTYS